MKYEDIFPGVNSEQLETFKHRVSCTINFSLTNDIAHDREFFPQLKCLGTSDVIVKLDFVWLDLTLGGFGELSETRYMSLTNLLKKFGYFSTDVMLLRNNMFQLLSEPECDSVKKK